MPTEEGVFEPALRDWIRQMAQAEDRTIATARAMPPMPSHRRRAVGMAGIAASD